MEWVPGRALGVLDLEPVETVDAWRALGRDLALLHTRVRKVGPAGALRTATALPDPRTLVEDRAHDGWFTALEARWLARWLERLAPAATVPVPPRFLHLDVQATNVLLRSDSLAYAALLDWGNAGWGDAAWDFFGIPLRAVPQVLAGHREVAPLDADESAEARILWRHLQMVLAILPRGPTPGLSWGERPLAWLLEVARFFFDAPHGRWRELAP